MSKSVVEGTKDAVAAADRAVSDTVVKGIEKGRKSIHSAIIPYCFFAGAHVSRSNHIMIADRPLQKRQQHRSSLLPARKPRKPMGPQVKWPVKQRERRLI